MRRKGLLIVAILLMSIGFAAVSTTLIINGNAKVNENTEDYSVIFTAANLDNEDVYNEVISEDKKIITFRSKDLKKLNDTSVLKYEVTNNSSNYDAEVRINCGVKENTEAKYTSINNVLEGNVSIVKAKESVNGTLTITLNKTSTEEVTEEYTCTLEFNAVERESIGISINEPAEPELTNELIPVVISNDGTVTYADISKEWYNYENKIWANAVIIKDNYEELNENGKVNGATREKNQINFDGIDDYINLGLENYDFKDSMAIAIKVKFNDIESTSNDIKALLGNWENGGGGIAVQNKKIYVQLYDCEQNKYVSGYAKTTLENDKWYTIILVLNNKKLQLYLNGVLESSENLNGSYGKSELALSIGANPQTNNTYTNFANISVKKVAIFDRSLSEDEIGKYYKEDITINDNTDLLKYVNFEGVISNNEIIPEDSIESYFVWIPRYRYKLFNTDDYSLTTVTIAAEVESKAQEIEIEFEDKTTKASTGSKKGEWLTHPAFTSFDTNGLWVGKFETGYKGATSVTGAQVNATDTSKVIIKPNVYSWRNITVKNIFETSYNYKREMDSHMMKNTEWGAVAYLSHSKYGINTELNINNNSSYKTGYSALKSTNQQIYPGEYGDGEKYNQPYNTEIGYLASTTGNISGVYDMSGGAHEYVSAYINGKIGSSGFSTTTIANYDNKYFDVYNESSTMTTYQYRILGDATGEMGPFNNYLDGDNTSRYHNSWYNDASDFITLSEPWFNRGGGYDNGVLASQFYFHRYTGGRHSNLGFRLVLTP